MKNTKRILPLLLSLIMLFSLFAGSAVTAYAVDNDLTDVEMNFSDMDARSSGNEGISPYDVGDSADIALTPGFYCLHPHLKTPLPSSPVAMKPVSSDYYVTTLQRYPQDTIDRVAAAVILRGQYFDETGITIDDGELQSTIWATVCKRQECLMQNNNNTNLHLNGRPNAEAYYNYVNDHYTEVIDRYIMTIWTSPKTGDPNVDYQDILEAKLVEKHSVPTVEKKVKDINDSASSSIESAEWQDSADHDIGDSIPFQITASMKEVDLFRTYYLEFVDHMTHLTFKPASIKITIDGVDKTSGFTVDWNADTKELNIKCDDIRALGAKNNSKVVVTYEATLDADAVIGESGNPNEVHLIYTRSTGSADKGITPTDKVTVFTYKMVTNKVDENGDALKGAAFELFKQSAKDGDYVSLGVRGAVKNPDGSYTLDQNPATTFAWNGIDDGAYKLVEVVTPVGYNTMKPLEFTVYALHEVLSEDPVLHYLESTYKFDGFSPYTPEEINAHYLEILEGTYLPSGKNEVFFSYQGCGEMEGSIENRPGSVLPETGGMGTAPIYLTAVVMMFSAAFLLQKKRRA